MPGYCAREEGTVSVAGHPVENDTGERDERLMEGEAAQQCGDRSALAACVDDQHDRPAGDPGELGGRTGFAFGAGPVEQPHHAFAKNDLGIGLELGDQPRQGRRPHRPDIEVRTRLAGRGGEEGRIDEIGPCFRRSDA